MLVQLSCLVKSMPQTKNLSTEKRAAVVTLSEEGYSGCAIARKLKISFCTVQGIIKKVTETGSVKDRPRCGCPSSTNYSLHSTETNL